MPQPYMPPYPKSGIGWLIIADSAVSNTGKPFYIPDGHGKAAVALGLAVKITRLGKSIRDKFASRYYQEFAPALHFYLPEFSKELREAGLSDDASRNFDKSLIVGDFSPKESFRELELWINGEKRVDYDLSHAMQRTDAMLCEISGINTMKMGDLIVPGVFGEVFLEEGDLLEVKKNGEKSFHVRVK